MKILGPFFVGDQTMTMFFGHFAPPKHVNLNANQAPKKLAQSLLRIGTEGLPCLIFSKNQNWKD